MFSNGMLPRRPNSYQENEIVTGGTSNATATIVRVDTENGRLVVKRLHTDSNAFQSGGRFITGGTSSTARTIHK